MKDTEDEPAHSGVILQYFMMSLYRGWSGVSNKKKKTTSEVIHRAQSHCPGPMGSGRPNGPHCYVGTKRSQRGAEVSKNE